MVYIVDSNSKAELETLISGLSLASETTANLVLILKTAILSGVSADTIKTELLSRLNSATTVTSLEEIALLSSALQFITSNRSLSVTNAIDLYSLSVDPGTIVFVTSENLPYVYRSDLTWVLLFPTITADLPVENAWAWGVNTNGILGDNTTTSRSSPVSVVGEFTDWAQVSAGNTHSLALRGNGLAWAWGSNVEGQLGDGTVTSRLSPVSVVGNIAWKDISAGDKHNLALRGNGSIWAWGLNSSGQLGDATTTNQSSPVSVVGGFTDWTQISAGYTHNLALRANGTAWSWGGNTNGQLGDASTTTRSSPVSVVGGFLDWIQVSAGGDHSIGIRTNGTAWAWGLNSSGQLGDATTTNQSSPVSVVGGFVNWAQVSAGLSHSVGLRTNGTAWAWGLNTSGQLGDGATTNQSSPVSVVGGFTNWAQLSAGNAHTSALRTNGSAWAWGINTSGQLGDGTTTNRSSPVSVVGGFTDWVQLSSHDQTLGIRT